MELLVGGFDDTTEFLDTTGSYLEVSDWPTVTYTNGSEAEFDYSFEDKEWHGNMDSGCPEEFRPLEK